MTEGGRGWWWWWGRDSGGGGGEGGGECSMLNIQTGLNVRHWTFRSFLRHWADKLVFVVVSAWIPYKHATMGQYWPIMACLWGSNKTVSLNYLEPIYIIILVKHLSVCLSVCVCVSVLIILKSYTIPDIYVCLSSRF